MIFYIGIDEYVRQVLLYQRNPLVLSSDLTMVSHGVDIEQLKILDISRGTDMPTLHDMKNDSKKNDSDLKRE